MTAEMKKQLLFAVATSIMISARVAENYAKTANQLAKFSAVRNVLQELVKISQES